MRALFKPPFPYLRLAEPGPAVLQEAQKKGLKVYPLFPNEIKWPDDPWTGVLEPDAVVLVYPPIADFQITNVQGGRLEVLLDYQAMITAWEKAGRPLAWVTRPCPAWERLVVEAMAGTFVHPPDTPEEVAKILQLLNPDQAATRDEMLIQALEEMGLAYERQSPYSTQYREVVGLDGGRLGGYYYEWGHKEVDRQAVMWYLFRLPRILQRRKREEMAVELLTALLKKRIGFAEARQALKA